VEKLKGFCLSKKCPINSVLRSIFKSYITDSLSHLRSLPPKHKDKKEEEKDKEWE